MLVRRFLQSKIKCVVAFFCRDGLSCSPETFSAFKERFQFLFTLSLFLPVIFSALYSGEDSQLEANKSMLEWGVMVAVLVLDYLLLEVRKKKMPFYVGEIIDMLVYIGLGSCIPILFILGYYAGKSTIEPIVLNIFGVLLACLMIVPLAIFLSLTLVNILLEKNPALEPRLTSNLTTKKTT